MSLEINYTTGYAGTGKSHTLISKVNSLPVDSTVVIAPTHKALARLREHLPEAIEIKTIHALLGWIPRINEQATKVSHIDVTHKLDKELDTYSDIIIDEAGMMSEEMFYDIISKIENQLYEYTDRGIPEPVVTIHCFLDPYQLLPVKGRQIQTDPLTTTNLTTQHRAESIDIVQTYTKFVNYLEGTNTKDLTIPYSDNIRPMNIKQFKRGDRLLAYTNKAVGAWNRLIATNQGIKSFKGQEVQLGNMIDTTIVVDFVDPSLTDLVNLYETQKLKLQNGHMSTRFIEASLKALIDNNHIKFIECIDSKVYPVIVGVDKANIAIKQAKEAAINDKSAFKDVYALGRAYTMDYAFATTVHKSQGSEFDTVFIDKADIQKSIVNNYYDTYVRLMYVALSRSKKLIYI